MALAQDIRYAVRMLLKHPGFSAIAVLTLALGIGSTTAIFTVVNAVLLRPLRFPRPDRLVEVHIAGSDGPRTTLPDTDFLAWRDANSTAEALAVFNTEAVNLTGDGAPERVSAASVTDGFFHVLEAPAAIGRVFQPGDDRPGAAKSTVLSHGFWQRRFHGDANVIGRSITLAGVPHTVVGVMPQDFRFPLRTIDLWQIHTIDPPTRRGPFYTWGIARLKPGVSIQQADANLRAVEASLRRQYPSADDWRFAVVPLQDALVGDVRRILLLLLGSVGFLLLIATANVANLLLARAATREREIAVRSALGASRTQIAAQLVTESLALAAAAGALGLAVAALGTRALIAFAPEQITRLADVGMSAGVFVFTLGVAVFCGMAFGVVPALRASRTPPADALKDGRSGTASVAHRRLQRGLVVVEIALALVLSIGAGLMIRSLNALGAVNPGFEPDHLLTFEIALPHAQYPDAPKVTAFYDAVVDRIEKLPGVRSAAVTISLPPNLLLATDNFMVEGQVVPARQSAPIGPFVLVGDGYFKTLGVPLVRGRFFDRHDTLDAAPVVIINETLASRYFAGADPIGRRLKDGGPERPVGPDNPWMTVVGVVGDLKYTGLDAAPDPTFYLPFRQNSWSRQYVVVRGAGDPRALAPAARNAVSSIDQDVPIFNVKTMDELISASFAPPAFRTILVTTFALLGLVLAAIGIYGVMAHAVAERTHELGVRIALGASRGDVVRLVVGEAAILAAAGVGLGLAGAFVTTRLMQSLLFGVTATDASTFVGISGVLVGTALAASYLPARRAMRVDPMVALRYE
jgi:putative ABC transport system permease protein